MRRRGQERALHSKNEPWSSSEVESISVDLDLHVEILEWIPSGTARACGYACGYASDFEITKAMAPFFKEIYEGEIRRQMRIIRKKGQVVTVEKEEHQHQNPNTERWQQCYRLPTPTPSLARKKPPLRSKVPPKRKRFIPHTV